AFFFFFSSRRRHTRCLSDWSSDVCSSDLVKGAGPAEEGNDGVVAYRSAHVDGAASELVVRSSHSTQSEPATVQEVRRILHLHGEIGRASCRERGETAGWVELLEERKRRRC